MTRRPPPEPPLNIPFLTAFVGKSRWMRKHGDWKERLLIRLASAYLDVLLRQEIAAVTAERQGAAEAAKPEGKWTKRVRK
jgi:hypothetical protein